MTARFDHLAILCTDLVAGTAAVEAQLGVALAPGGKHDVFGTHNRLLSLGPDAYLEVIAIDPEAPPPGRTRWFDLDRFRGLPRLVNWAVQVPDLALALAAAPDGAGESLALARGAYRWRMAVPRDGVLPFDGGFPALLAWDGPHPAAALPDAGCRLTRLEVRHPDPQALSAVLPPDLLASDPRLRLLEGPPGLRACIETPSGPRWI